MQENQDDIDIVETSEPFSITLSVLKRHIISSADCN